MKKQLTVLFALIAANFFIYSSCNKSDYTPPTPKTKTQLLTQGSWKFKGATANGGDASGYLSACQKDNIYTFVAGGTGTANEGATTCNPGDPQSTPLTWSFMTNETILHINTALFTNTSNDFTLMSLSETELVVSTTYTPIGGPAILVTITFQH
ncbi:MAG TPA: lipocalin family protein [Chitinophagaceae bacterium]|nr:lipocalin family protein [Chitinophagaceae bacterium]